MLQFFFFSVAINFPPQTPHASQDQTGNVGANVRDVMCGIFYHLINKYSLQVPSKDFGK